MNQVERERYFRLARVLVERYEANWDEAKHKRGQPGNAGQFGPGGGQAKPATTGKPPAASPPAPRKAGGSPEEKAQPWPGHEAATPPDGAVGPEKDATTPPPPGKAFRVDPSNEKIGRASCRERV